MASSIGRRSPAKGGVAALAASAGEVRDSALNMPVDLNDMESAWFVERGELDISVAEFEDADAKSPFRHLFKLTAGRLAFGVNHRPGNELRLIAKGLPGTRLRKLPIGLLLEEAAGSPRDAFPHDLVALTDAWIEDFAAAVAREIAPRPVPAARLNPGRSAELSTEGALYADRGVVWLVGNELEAAFLQLEDAESGGAGLMPLTRDAWAGLRRTQDVSCIASAGFDIEVLIRRALPEFHRLALGAASLNRKLLLVDSANLQVAQFYQRYRDELAARQDLVNLYGKRAATRMAGGQALAAAIETIARHEGFGIAMPEPVAGREPGLREILAESGLRARQVRLAREDRWWRGDSGALLAFRREDERPMVLMPGIGGSYRLIDPVSAEARGADATTSAELRDHVWQLYRALPRESPVAMGSLFGISGRNGLFDLIWLAAAGMGAGILALAPAVAANLLVGTVIPSGSIGLLAQFTAAVAGTAVIAALAHMLRGTALMRLEGRVASRLSAALWDRLLRLKPAFFRRFTTGDILARAMSFQNLRDRVSGAASDALLSTIFLLPTFGMVFYYDRALGWFTLGLGISTLSVISLLALLLVEPQRRHLKLERRLTGDLVQFIGGIVKLRILGAEGSAFAAWAKRFREQKRAEIRISVLSEHIAAFGAAVPVLGGAALFAVALTRGGDALAPADFVAVYTASLVFYLSVATIGRSLEEVASVVSGLEQVKPILEAAMDLPPPRRIPVRLDGEFSLHRVVFRYVERGPKVLDGVSLRAGPGEFIGIVGESGSGKSTLFRIALGLENPVSGAVYYDGKDLAHLDLESVRRQLGVVTQDGNLQGGTIMNNILGTGLDMTVDDAWRAAREAAVDRDIAAMPMQMYTAVGEEGTTFSGGQGQRIRIAAALAHRPRILFMDEPTSWLDNQSQAETMRGIESSAGTRIVIAHRLSTIRNADRIYVIQAGRVAQAGNFDELMQIDGPFRELAQRQMY